MKNILIILFFILFIFNINSNIYTATESLYVWSKNIYPVLLPSLVLFDYLISSNILIKLTNLINKIIKINSYYLYIFIISIFIGTPSNSKYLLKLYKENKITLNELNAILSCNITFNPLFIIKMTNLKIFIIYTLSNFITLLINKSKYKKMDYQITNFNINTSIKSNLTILINILGTLTIFMVINNMIKLPILACILEITSGLINIDLFITNKIIKDILYLFTLSFGSISILFQIKSILKDTFINYRLLLKNRLLAFLINLVINLTLLKFQL